MKSIITLIFAYCLYVINCFGQDLTSYPLKAEARIAKQAYYPFIDMELYGFQSTECLFQFGKVSKIELEVTNTSNKTVYFWAMSCSWEATLTFSNPYIQSWRWGCDKNIGTLKVLKPGESEVFKTAISISPEYNYTYLRIIEGRKIAATKLGFIIIADFYKDDYSFLWKRLWREDASLYEYANKKENQVAIIWSNPLSFI